jgi:hypothetical protein
MFEYWKCLYALFNKSDRVVIVLGNVICQLLPEPSKTQKHLVEVFQA